MKNCLIFSHKPLTNVRAAAMNAITACKIKLPVPGSRYAYTSVKKKKLKTDALKKIIFVDSWKNFIVIKDY